MSYNKKITDLEATIKAAQNILDRLGSKRLERMFRVLGGFEDA